MFTKKLMLLAALAAMGLSMSAAQARDYGHRDGNRGFNHASQHGDFRHGHNARHHHHRHHAPRGHR